MKTIGMIGGVSWQSTIEYYRIINEVAHQKLGGSHSAKIVMSSVDFEPLVKWGLADNWDKIIGFFVNEVKRIEAAHADFFIVCANTMHKFADHLVKAVNIPMLHIVDVVADEIKKKSLKKVGLLGTNYTMEGDFYPKHLERQGIELVVPNASTRSEINRIIYEELVRGIFSESSRNTYLRAVDSLVENGAEGIVLGCTEIPLLIQQDHIRVPVLDTTKIHAESAAEMALSQRS